MSDVKRYTTNEAYALMPYGAKVIAEADYDALLVELEGERENAKEWLVEHYALQAERDQLRAELEAIRGQQAVAWVSPDVAGGVRWSVGALQQLSDGSPLYALPPQQPYAVSVPRELLERLAKKAEVFDDGSDGADAESARSVAETLRALLSTKNAEEGE